jgi:serine/threonine protein kinase
LVSDLLQEVLSQIAHGLAYLHSRWNIAHLDIKPENLYTTDRGIYKLGDLGLASLGDRFATDICCYEVIGTYNLLQFFNRRDSAEEGDKRYLSREMLQHNDCDLFKVHFTFKFLL